MPRIVFTKKQLISNSSKFEAQQTAGPARGWPGGVGELSRSRPERIRVRRQILFRAANERRLID
jgi:hypothetical protein